MNASERATGLDTANKIATVVNLFKAEFPDAKADLKPWKNDPHTRELIDPDSLDIGFHFPGWSRRFQSNSILVQIRLHQDSLDNQERLIGLEVAGFSHQGQAWRLSTIEYWQFMGKNQPVEDVKQKLKLFCRQVFELFSPR
ncbi:MAG: hypothetical protein QNJ34_02805 [Xenococcaceae cyanobacterium MO_188.B29]|nr:hypothetical protein [Xenococcaceae cyanobacterium MO_188.B29]